MAVGRLEGNHSTLKIQTDVVPFSAVLNLPAKVKLLL